MNKITKYFYTTMDIAISTLMASALIGVGLVCNVFIFKSLVKMLGA